ncbi:MAG TPA: hypothetical protein VKY26_07615 [Actinomycetota bacterium]|nr:hypothetical protein [Actinomycetota bacterium]
MDGDGATDLPPASQMFLRVLKLFFRVFLVMVVLAIIWFIFGVLGSFARVVVGGLLALAVASLMINYFRQVGHPPPPDPEPTAVHPGLRLAYVCEMCGLELAVLKVAKDRAPKHCGEAMELVRRPAAAAAPGGEPDPEP